MEQIVDENTCVLKDIKFVYKGLNKDRCNYFVQLLQYHLNNYYKYVKTYSKHIDLDNKMV